MRNTIHSIKWLLCFILILSFVSISGINTAKAQAINLIAIAPGASPLGRGYSDWSANWWQWAYSIPADQHPLLDNPDCNIQQSENVWFLGGTFASRETSTGVIESKADRSCTIPSSKFLFFPIINSECSMLEGTSEADLRDCAGYFADFIGPGSLFLVIDGKPVTNQENSRVQSPLFTIGPLPENNLFQYFGIEAPVGTTTPAVSDGYYVMITPLPVGTHEIHYGGVADFTRIGGPLFTQDIHYTITVVPSGLYN